MGERRPAAIGLEREKGFGEGLLRDIFDCLGLAKEMARNDKDPPGMARHQLLERIVIASENRFDERIVGRVLGFGDLFDTVREHGLEAFLNPCLCRR
jgi:hypothetical protein